MFDYEVVVCGSVTVAWSARGFSVLLCWLWGHIAGRVIISSPYNNFHSHRCNIHANPHCRDRDWRLGGCVLLAKRVVVIANWQPRFSLIWKKKPKHWRWSRWVVTMRPCETPVMRNTLPMHSLHMTGVSQGQVRTAGWVKSLHMDEMKSDPFISEKVSCVKYGGL